MIFYDMRHDNDCLRACVETVLQCPGDVPNFVQMELLWYDELTEWCRERGLEPNIQHPERFSPPGLYIAIGDSPRNSRGHAVVYLDSKMLFDPHKSRDGLRNTKSVLCFFLRDVVRFTHWRNTCTNRT